MIEYAFDLGDTLITYEGIPLSWESHYSVALTNAFLTPVLTHGMKRSLASIFFLK
jgi:hypothetical protein